VNECLSCLKAVAQRDEDEAEGAAHEIQRLFEDFLIKDLWVLKTKDGRTFYLRKMPDLDDAVSFQPILRFDDKKEGSGKLVQGKNIEKIGRAPQSILAEKIRPLVHLGQSEGTWQRPSMDIAERT